MSNKILKAACVQMNSGPDIAPNLVQAESLIREAAAAGARFIMTPENTCHMRFPTEQKRDSALFQNEHPGVPLFADLAAELGVTLVIGSMTIKTEREKLLNRQFVFGSDGSLRATYDKIHLFDVQLPSGEMHRESDIIEGGQKAVTVSVEDELTLGCSICYDLRFAYLYRALAQAGASVLCVPAAFTVPTGQAHWRVLLRARAIETGSFVIAAGQGGEHEGGRKTYGHSMMVDPWGEVLAEAANDAPSIITADIDLSRVDKVRRSIPALNHDRAYEMESK